METDLESVIAVGKGGDIVFLLGPGGLVIAAERTAEAPPDRTPAVIVAVDLGSVAGFDVQPPSNDQSGIVKRAAVDPGACRIDGDDWLVVARPAAQPRQIRAQHLASVVGGCRIRITARAALSLRRRDLPFAGQCPARR